MSRKRIRRILYAISFLVITAGVLALGYPLISDWINEKNTSKLYQEYSEMSRQLDVKVIDDMLKDARDFNRRLLSNPSRWVPDGVNEALYESILDTSGTGIICYVEIPKINARMPVYHGTSEAVLQVGVGHMLGSSFPIGEAGEHAILSGHNGMISASIFTELDKMEIGDKFYINVLGNKLDYQVTKINVVLPEDFSYFGIDADSDMVTLVTCTPFGVNSHRLLVTGERVDYSIDSDRLEVRFE